MMTNSSLSTHFDLSQPLRPAGAVGRVCQLGDDALEAQPAGVPEHHLAALGEVLAVS